MEKKFFIEYAIAGLIVSVVYLLMMAIKYGGKLHWNEVLIILPLAWLTLFVLAISVGVLIREGEKK